MYESYVVVDDFSNDVDESVVDSTVCFTVAVNGYIGYPDDRSVSYEFHAVSANYGDCVKNHSTNSVTYSNVDVVFDNYSRSCFHYDENFLNSFKVYSYLFKVGSNRSTIYFVQSVVSSIVHEDFTMSDKGWSV